MSNDDYTVGKNKPPSNTQWTTGNSGNKKGRPKGSKNRSTVILKTLNKVVTANVEGTRKKITITEAVLTKLAAEALTGKVNAIQSILALWKESEELNAAACDNTYPFSDHDREVIATIHERMNACNPEKQS